MMERRRADGLQIIADDIGNDQDHAPRPGKPGQPATFDQREMLAHGVHLIDGQAAFEEQPCGRLQVRKGHRRDRPLQQGGTPSGEQVNKKIVLPQTAEPVGNHPGRIDAALVRYRMRTDTDRHSRQRTIVMIGDDHPACYPVAEHLLHGPRRRH